MRRILAVAILAATTFHAVARDLPTASPESVGMSRERLDRIGAAMRRYVDEGKIAGMVTLVARHGKIVYANVVGKQDVTNNTALARDTLFRIYSMTKPITAVAAMTLYEEGRFQLTDPVSTFLPEFKDQKVFEDGQEVASKTPMTMQHLLSHTGGLAYGFDKENPVERQYWDRELLLSPDLTEFAQRLSRIPLRFQPGSRWYYSLSSDVAGAVVERISGMPFDQFLKTHLFTPLGMHDTFFDVPVDQLHRFGPNYHWNAETKALEALPVPKYPIYQNTTFFSGGGGLVSTAGDYMRFCEMLRAGGALDGARILSPKTIRLMTTNMLPAVLHDPANRTLPSEGDYSRGYGFGLGVGVLVDVAASAVAGSVGAYTWGGAAGTNFWVDPVEDVVVVSMIQLMDSPWSWDNELRALTYQAITKLN
jgi:CubicO group peptidase (beta-lactamase class C family)